MSLECKGQKVTLLISKPVPDETIQVEEQTVHVDNPDIILNKTKHQLTKASVSADESPLHLSPQQYGGVSMTTTMYCVQPQPGPPQMGMSMVGNNVTLQLQII